MAQTPQDEIEEVNKKFLMALRDLCLKELITNEKTKYIPYADICAIIDVLIPST